jgi:hypothetical protein
MGLGGMIRWHNALGLPVQNTSPFVDASKCQSEWSYANLVADEDYDKALQARAKASLGGAKRRNIFC